jgi:hypothetical protein
LLALNDFAPELVLESKYPGAKGAFGVLRQAPSLACFDKVLVKVTDSNGQDIFLNDTDQYAQLGTTPGNKKIAFYPASGKISRIRLADTGLETSKETQYALRLAKNGDAKVTIENTYRGMNFAEVNKELSTASLKELEQYTQKEISEFNRSAELLGEHEFDFDSYPGRERLELLVPELAQIEEEYMVLDIPGLIKKLKGAGTDARELPLLRKGGHRQKITMHIDLPDGFQVQSMPSKRTKFVIPGSGPIVMTAHQSAKDRIEITQEADLGPVIISPCDYQTYLQVQNELAKPKNNLLVLKHAD